FRGAGKQAVNRLQKKCLVTSLGLHALLCLILIVGPAFLWSKQKELDLPILEVIPDRLTDLPFSGGGNPKAKPPPQIQAAQLPPPVQQTKPPPKERETKVEPEAVALERKKPKPEIKVETKIVKRPANETPEKKTMKP